MLKEIIEMPNCDIKGDPFYMKVPIYFCDRCDIEFDVSNPHCVNDNKHYCWECGFIEDCISEKEYLTYSSGLGISKCRAYVENGKVKIKYGKYTPDELRIRRNKRARERYKQNKVRGG